MDWNDTIIVTLHGDRKGKAVIPRTVVKAVSSTTKRDYSGSSATDKEITLLHVDTDFAEAIGIELKYIHKDDKTIAIECETPLKIVLELLRGSVTAEVLF